MASSGTAKTSILCELTDWRTRQTNSHLAKTAEIKYRYLISCLSNGWALSFEQEDSVSPVNKKFAARFADLICSFKTEAGIDPIEGINTVVASLSKLTGKKISFDKKGLSGSELWVELGRQVDVAFDVDYNAGTSGSVRARLFGDEGDDE